MRKRARQDERVSMYLRVNTFRLGTDKEAALKPLEEAAEIFGAWQNAIMFCPKTLVCEACDFKTICDADKSLALEIADCVTACCNLAARYDLDLENALKEVETHNRERGRYGA